jgi:hypothetical protein
MKKINFLFIVFLFVTYFANAQITITQNDFPVTGTYFVEVVDTLCAAVPVGNSGTNQTWNLANIGNSYIDTSYWANPASVSGVSYFPTSTLVNQSSSGDNLFVKLSSTAFEMMGFYGDGGSGFGTQAAVFTPPYKYTQIPSTYQTTYSGTYNFEMKFAYPQPPIDSIKMKFAVNYTTLVDGWGTVTTPIYSNVSCLRQKNYAIATITGSAHASGVWVPTGTPSKDTTINYLWFSNTHKNVLANLEVDPDGKVTQANYLKSEGIGTGINETTQNHIKVEVFPNPASDVINFNGVQQNTVLVIFDSNSKLMTNKLLNTRKNTINVSDYSNGMYFYQILDMKGQTLDNGKFSVVK